MITMKRLILFLSAMLSLLSTDATLALSKGMPIESVSRVLGHTNIVTTQIYAKITSQKLNNDLTMLGDKLNASFKNIKTI